MAYKATTMGTDWPLGLGTVWFRQIFLFLPYFPLSVRPTTGQLWPRIKRNG